MILKKEKISVIVPAYNAENRIERCITSILRAINQTDEIIIVNDGSSDKTESVVRSICDSRIKLINQRNLGVSAARNRGLQEASGVFVAFVDSDDEVKETLFEKLRNNISDYNEIVVSGYQMVDESGNELYSNYDKLNSLTKTVHPKDVACDYFNFFKAGVINSCCGKLYPRNLVEGKSFNTDLKMGEDASFNLEVFRLCNTIKIIPVTDYLYFQSSTQSSRRIQESMDKMLCSHFSDIDSFIREYNGYNNVTVCKGMGWCWANTLVDYMYDYCGVHGLETKIEHMLEMPWTKYISSNKEIHFGKRIIVSQTIQGHGKKVLMLLRLIKCVRG